MKSAKATAAGSACLSGLVIKNGAGQDEPRRPVFSADTRDRQVHDVSPAISIRVSSSDRLGGLLARARMPSKGILKTVKGPLRISQAERLKEEVGRSHHSLLLGEGAVLLRGGVGGLLEPSLEKKVAWCHVMGTSVQHQGFCFLIIDGHEQLGHARQILCTKSQLSERGASAHRVHSGRTHPRAAQSGKEAPPASLMNV